MINIYITTVILIGTVLALFSILTFLTKKPFSLINIIIILFMTALVSPMLVKLTYAFNLFPYSRMFEFLRAAPFTFGPFLYFYAKAETGLINKLSRRDYIHFLPFIAAGIIMMLCGTPDYGHHGPAPDRLPGPPQIDSSYHMLPPPAPGSEFQDQIILPHPAGLNIFRFLGILIFTSLTFYTILIIRLIHKHNSGIIDYFSTDTIEINLKWIKWITVCFLLSYLFVMVDGIFLTGHHSPPSILMSIAPDLATSFFIFMFNFFSLKQPVIYPVNKNGTSSYTASTIAEKRYEKSGLKEETAEKYCSQIIEFMSLEKPYIDPDITINSLSERTGIPKHHLTQVINEKINKNFFMFINEYRINEVKEKINQDISNEYPILRIAFDAGFNSKSTFNAMFKKITGITPSEYRKTVTDGK